MSYNVNETRNNMQTFAIITNSEKIRLSQREKLLQKHQIKPYEQIIIGKSEGTIASVRNAQRKLQFGLAKGRYQALIVENIEKFALPAQQALLKTLEEPPNNTIIIIESENREQVIPTILSRSQVIYIPSFESLTKDEEAIITLFWSKLLRNDSLALRLGAAADLIVKLSDRETLVNWLNQQIIFFRQLLTKRVGQKLTSNNLTPYQISRCLRIMLFTKKQVLGNVNLKLLVDHLFINIPSLQP